MSTAFYSHADFAGHDMGRGHPECPERVGAIADHLRSTGLDALLVQRDAPFVADVDLLAAHGANHVAELKETMAQASETGRSIALDPDTTASPGTANAVLRAAGAAVAATDAVIDGEVENAFCAIRPPGHHATKSRAMGFCFFNSVAIAARHALDVRGLDRVAIIDFDVHHGNGTEDIVAGDERILMVSFFQHPLYPGTGVDPLGDNMLNVPIAPYTKGPAIREIIDDLWIPRLDAFRPQMIFISAGFDAHREDGLGQLGLVESDYAWITGRIMAVAARHAGGRVVSCLEGGYNLGALSRSVAAHVRVLAGVD